MLGVLGCTRTVCDERFDNRKSYNYHLETVHHKKNLKCVHCNKLFKRKRDLQRHKDEQHKGGEAQFKCKFCNFVSKRKYNLNKHMEKFHENDANQKLLYQRITCSPAMLRSDIL